MNSTLWIIGLKLNLIRIETTLPVMIVHHAASSMSSKKQRLYRAKMKTDNMWSSRPTAAE